MASAAVFPSLPELPNDQLPTINQPATILGVGITFQAIAWIAVAFRVFARVYLAHSPGWDDLFVVLASMAATAGTSILSIQPYQGGMGQHMLALTIPRISNYLKLLYVSNAAYLAATTFIKVSILFQYLRIFSKTRHPRLRKFIMVLLGFVAAWGTAFTLTALFSCTPVQKAWDFPGTDTPGSCVMFGSKNKNTFFAAFTGHAVSNMILDGIILFLPIPYWKEISSNRKSKFALVGLFAIGVVVVSISIARLATLIEHRAGTAPDFDLTFYGPPVFIASVLEVQVAVLAASIPIFWPIIESLGMGNILVVNEVSVRTEAPSRTAQNGPYSDSDTELRYLRQSYQKDNAIAGFADPMSDGTDAELKHNPHFSTHCMSTEPPIAHLEAMHYYNPPRNAAPPKNRKF